MRGHVGLRAGSAGITEVLGGMSGHPRLEGVCGLGRMRQTGRTGPLDGECIPSFVRALCRTFRGLLFASPNSQSSDRTLTARQRDLDTATPVDRSAAGLHPAGRPRAWSRSARETAAWSVAVACVGGEARGVDAGAPPWSPPPPLSTAPGQRRPEGRRDERGGGGAGGGDRLVAAGARSSGGGLGDADRLSGVRLLQRAVRL